ncbi:MAG: calcium-translocating P-type ATPase, PMCA-type [Alloprevotella sp.]|nr:calcium-translocating P-type ATPase, PMCA-type [Alloprevotella sp.]
MSQYSHRYIGLTDEQVVESRQRHGDNVLTPPKKRSLWFVFLEKFLGPFGHYIKGGADGDALIFILEIAAILSIVISLSEYMGWFGLSPQGATVFFEPIGIIVAIFLATGVAFYFEHKAEEEFALLNQVNADELVVVIRNGQTHKVAKREVVVGDLLVLSMGDEVAADAQLLNAVNLEMDESSLTGEPSCSKTILEEHFEQGATFPSNHVLRGTKVLSGHGIAQVFAVGDQTEQGHVFVATQIDSSVKTPLDEQLTALGKQITIWSYSVAILVVVGRLIMYFVNAGDVVWPELVAYALKTLMIAVTLIVVAVPEGLPMAVSLSLAYSMRRMLRNNNLVRKLHACETMGATTVICTDKTGTLTQNQMEVSDVAFCVQDNTSDSQGAIPMLIAKSVSLNSTADLDFTASSPQVVGNPTEGALLLWLYERGIDYRQIRESVEILQELPFTPEKKYMATIVQTASGLRQLYVKGAPEILLGLSDKISGGVSREEVQSTLLAYQSQAKRTLALAYKDLAPEEQPFTEDVIRCDGLTFLGTVAIADPVRPDVPVAVAECMGAGIKIIIVTGDTIETSKEIAIQIGLWNDKEDNASQIMTGEMFASKTNAELYPLLDHLKIIARARPMDKRRLVELLQQQGHVVAVTGDGTNDAPALKLAHVGLSMGTGTSVAKEASDITILDNSFSSIGRAVMWGRSLYHNLQRFLYFQLTVNIVACLVVLIGAFTGIESPLTVTQMLWVNLIMDTFAAVALASLPPSHAVMSEKPRSRTAFIVTKSMWQHILLTGGVFSLILWGVLYIFQHASIDSLCQLPNVTLQAYNGLSPYELSLFFTLFVLLQFWNMFNVRAFMTHQSAFRLRHCEGFCLIAGIIIVGQVLIVSCFDELFSVVPIKFSDWIILLLASSIVLWLGEFKRLFYSSNP